MASHRALSRALVLVAAAAIAALPLTSGLTALAPAAPVRAALLLPSISGPQYTNSPGNNIGKYPASAGLVDFTNGDSGVPPPTPASVTAEAGGQPLQGTAIFRADLAGTPLASTRLVDLQLENLPSDIPLSTIPFQRSIQPSSWPALLASVPRFAGLPLQSVTYAQVRAVAAFQTDLDKVTVGDVDWSRSVLADLPLAALTFNGELVDSIDIPLQPGEPSSDTIPEKWCYLLNAAQAGACPSATSLDGKSLIELGIEGAPLKNIPLKNIPLKNIDIATSPLKNIPLKNIVLNVSPLKNIPLKNIDMAGAPLKNIPLKNILLDQAGNPTTSPLKNIPLKNIDWATSPLKNIPLKNINLTTSPLKNIPLKNIDWVNAPLKNIPLKNINLTTSPLKNIPLKNIDFANAPLKNIPLKNIDFSSLAAAPLKNIPLKNIAAVNAPLKNIPLKNIDWAAAPLKNIPLKNIDLTASGIGSLPLAAIDWTDAALGTRLASDFTTTGAPFATPPAAGATLAQVATAGGFTAGATLAQLDAALLGASPDILLGDLRLDLAGATAPAVTLDALLHALATAQADPVLGDLVSPTATLGDLGLDLLTDTGVTVGDLLAILLPGAADVLLGDLRIDRLASPLATTVGDLLAIVTAAQVPAPTVGDLALDKATGVDALVLDAITGFLLDPATFAEYLLGALGTWTDDTGHDITLGELGIWTDDTGADITLGELAQYLDDTVSLADVLLGLVPPDAFPFENFPIASLGLNDVGRQIETPTGPWGGIQGGYIPQPPIIGVWRMLNSGSQFATDPFDMVVYLAPGSHVEAGSVFVSVGGPAVSVTPVIETAPDGRVRVLLPFPSMPASNVLGNVQMSWFDDIRLGDHPLETDVLDPNTGEVLETLNGGDRTVEDGAEPDSPLETIAQAAEPGEVRGAVLPTNAFCAQGQSCTYIDSMISGFISFPGDVDWYKLPAVRAGSRITADLTNLPLDADLVLYGPSGISSSPSVFPNAQDLPGRYVDDPGLGVGRAATAVAAEALNDLQLDQGYDDPFIGSPGPTHIPALTPLSISQHHGTDPESVGVIAPVDGTYVVAVTGYNGATSNDPYLVRARVFTPSQEATCTPRTFASYPAAGAIPAIASDVDTVFLTNPSRLAATYGSTAANALATKLAALVTNAATKGIKAAIVPVDAYPGVGDAYTAWDANPCSVSGANAVASAITGVLKVARTSAPGIVNVSLVGGDDILPMGRTPDLTRVANESDYASTFGDAKNPISAAEAAGYTLTDDIYGDTSPKSTGDGNSLFVPRLAVGRLVETPTEIGNLLQAYINDADGKLDTGTALVAGYDFLADGAHAVASRLATGGRTVDSSLIDDYGATQPWTSTQLLAKLFPTAGVTPGIDSINAHYDHTALLPSAGNTGASGDLVTASQVLAKSSVDNLLDRLLFTMGCHAGLSVPDSYIQGSGATLDTLRLDWAQALSQAKVAVYVANTGFGVGDTTSVAYSERLMGLYAKLLDGNLTVGQALAYAKQAYYGSLGAVGVYDFKILEQTAFYGLPFWKVSTSTPPAPPTAPAPPAAPATDATTGLQASSFTVAPNLQEGPSSSLGQFWTVAGFDPQVTQYRPVEPKMSIPVGIAGQTAHGALITALTSHDVTINPVVSTPTIDLSTSTPEAPIGATAWPARPATISTYQAPYGTAQDLVLVPGQFIGSATGTTGTQRLFDTVGMKVYYAPGATTDFDPPTILSTRGDPTGANILFNVKTTDTGGAVKRVLVAFHDFDGSWKFVDLASSDAETWTGTTSALHAFATGEEAEYFVQVVDAAGNVSAVSNKAQNYAARIPDTTAPIITASVSPAPNSDGWIKGAAVVTFTCSDPESGLAAGACPGPQLVTKDGETFVQGSVTNQAQITATTGINVQLDGTAPSITASVSPAGWTNAASATVTFTCSDETSGVDVCPAPVTVSGEGTTVVQGTVDDIAGNAATVHATVQLDRGNPTITGSALPGPNGFGWNNSAVTVTFTCGDALSGIAAGACPPSQTVSTEGTTLVNGSVTDQAGNTTVAATTIVRLDKTKPTIVPTVAPAPNAAGWNKANVTVSFTCDDALSGLEATACPASQSVTTEGTTTVIGSVTDRAGNTQAAPTTTVKLDKTAPTVTYTGAGGTVLTCKTTDDNGSGVKTPATGSNVTVRVSGLPTTTLTCTGATDVADNVAAPFTHQYVAPFTFGGFLDPVNNAPVVNNGNAGRTYPIKFKLTGIDGLPITVLPAVTSTQFKAGLSCTGLSDPLDTSSAGNSQLTFDATTNTFQYNWKTPSTKGCYEFDLGLADGSTKTVLFNLK